MHPHTPTSVNSFKSTILHYLRPCIRLTIQTIEEWMVVCVDEVRVDGHVVLAPH